MPRHAMILLTACCLGIGVASNAHAEAGRFGTLGHWNNGGVGDGNWGGSSFTIGRSTIYANGLVANQIGDLTYFNNGLVARQMGAVTIYTNGLVSVDGARARYFSNRSVGVPIRGRSGGMVYGGGSAYPLGPTAFPVMPR